MPKKTSPANKSVKKTPSKPKTRARELASLEEQLAQRETELDLINSVQAGLASREQGAGRRAPTRTL